jgi:hypothetical protein
MIIASVVTIPDRIQLLIEALNSILVSTQRPDFLYVSVAKWYPRLKKSILTEELNILTDYLDSFEISNKLVQYDEDIGPLMKFLTPLENHEITNQDHILIFDDDVGMFPDGIRLLKGCADLCGWHGGYGFIGVGFDSNWYLHGEYIQGGEYFQLKLIGGYRGCLYPVAAFDIENLKEYFWWIINEFKNRGSIPLHDDHIISAYCLNNNIPLRLVNIKEKLGDPPGSELYYTSKETSNGIMQSPDKDQNWVWLFEILRQRDIVFDYF